VAIFGGGIAGLTAAHELIERGFAVDVYERREIAGGKARSMGAPGTASGGRPALPGEHGLRFFPSFYQHLDDTMKRIPFGVGGRRVYDNLVDLPMMEVATIKDRRRDRSLTRFPLTLQELRMALRRPALLTRLPYRDLAFFMQRLLMLLTSCDDRKMNVYEGMSWWEFVRAAERSEAFRIYLGHSPQVLVALSARDGSARTVGNTLVQIAQEMMRPGAAADRVLDGPTNARWIDPWVHHLLSLGVRFHFGHALERLHLRQGRIVQATTRDPTGARHTVHADQFVSALPAEVLNRHVDDPLRAAAPSLATLGHLKTEWMVGIQFYLRTDRPILCGHGMFPDTPWALTAIAQSQYWARPATDYGCGRVRTILSVIASDWETPGLITGRPAGAATSADEIRREVWAQLKAALNRPGRRTLRDEDVLHWHLDPGVSWAGGQIHNDDALFVNTIDSWKHRPEATTAIDNFFLCGDFVRTHTDLATMEGANEAGRRATNGILAATRASAPLCDVHPLRALPFFDALRSLDQRRYDRGLPHWLARRRPPPRSSPTGRRSEVPEITPEILRNAEIDRASYPLRTPVNDRPTTPPSTLEY